MLPANIMGCLPLFKLSVVVEVVEVIFAGTIQYLSEDVDNDCLWWADVMGTGGKAFCALFAMTEVGTEGRAAVCALFATTEAGTKGRAAARCLLQWKQGSLDWMYERHHHCPLSQEVLMQLMQCLLAMHSSPYYK